MFRHCHTTELEDEEKTLRAQHAQSKAELKRMLVEAVRNTTQPNKIKSYDRPKPAKQEAML